jgi:DNA-binding response OmpR family regulator
MYPRLLEIQKEEQELFARLLALSRERDEILAGTERTEEIDFSVFKGTTARLLTQMWEADGKQITLTDIQDDIIGDDMASDQAIWSIVKRAKQELKDNKFDYTIKSIKGEGYKLQPILGKKCSIIGKHHKKPRKTRTKI